MCLQPHDPATFTLNSPRATHKRENQTTTTQRTSRRSHMCQTNMQSTQLETALRLLSRSRQNPLCTASICIVLFPTTHRISYKTGITAYRDLRFGPMSFLHCSPVVRGERCADVCSRWGFVEISTIVQGDRYTACVRSREIVGSIIGRRGYRCTASVFVL